MALDGIGLLPLGINALVDEGVESLAVKTVEKVAEPLAVHMHPVPHVREVAAELDLIDEIEELRDLEAFNHRYVRDFD
jgi:hypothetical protein